MKKKANDSNQTEINNLKISLTKIILTSIRQKMKNDLKQKEISQNRKLKLPKSKKKKLKIKKRLKSNKISQNHKLKHFISQ